MKKKLLAITLCILIVISIFPLTALAYSFGSVTYNDNDYGKLRAFLETESAVSGVKNGQQINPGGYIADDPATWTGVTWSGGRARYIGLGSEWDGKSLKGSLDISGFDALTVVICQENQITSVNASGDTSLLSLNFYKNEMTAVDVSGCTSLTGLGCDNNKLTALDVHMNTQLEILNCNNNEINTLDCSALTALKTLHCEYNNLAVLDISKNIALEALGCAQNNLTSLDVSANTALTYLDYSDNTLPFVDISNNTSLQILACNSTGTSSLNLSAFSKLLWLACDHNNLTSLDLSASTALVYIMCTDNPLSSIKAVFNDKSVNLKANGGGYIELYRFEDGYYAAASPAGAFVNWTDASGTVVSTAAKLNLADATAYELTANFPYTVTFDKNGGDMDSSPASLAAVGGSKLTKPATDPKRTGFVFGGWYKDAACTSAWDFGSDTVQANTTLYAKWTKLTLVSSVSSGSVYTGARITLTPNVSGGIWNYDSAYFSREGNTFTALKAGKSTITYTVGSQTTSYDVVIPESKLPQTGQNYTIVYMLLGLIVLALVGGIL